MSRAICKIHWDVPISHIFVAVFPRFSCSCDDLGYETSGLHAVLSFIEVFPVHVLDLESRQVDAVQSSRVNRQAAHLQALKDRDPTGLAEFVRMGLWTEKVRLNVLLIVECDRLLVGVYPKVGVLGR